MECGVWALGCGAWGLEFRVGVRFYTLGIPMRIVEPTSPNNACAKAVEGLSSESLCVRGGFRDVCMWVYGA